MARINCFICNRPSTDGVEIRSTDRFSGLIVECSQCGLYELEGYDGVNVSWDENLRAALSCAARQATQNGERLRITSANADAIAATHMHTRVADNEQRLLVEIGRRCGRITGLTFFDHARDFTVIDCFSVDEFYRYITELDKQKLIFATNKGFDTNVEFLHYGLTMEGWKRIQPLPRPGGIPGRCFVAMWFSEDLRAAFEQGIAPAISAAGFTPIRIDQKERNNEITDEIMAEIRNSQFVVADFTGQRSGVYYEAGFAMGLGRPVIWCCRKDDIPGLHFDTNHRNHIDWETPEELRRRLEARIRVTILEQA